MSFCTYILELKHNSLRKKPEIWKTKNGFQQGIFHHLFLSGISDHYKLKPKSPEMMLESLPLLTEEGEDGFCWSLLPNPLDASEEPTDLKKHMGGHRKLQQEGLGRKVVAYALQLHSQCFGWNSLIWSNFLKGGLLCKWKKSTAVKKPGPCSHFPFQRIWW